jgi:UDP:flavonoid glycosyltransferase YjiC (YdhE family)
MTRVLFTTDPITGHVRPALGVARSLVDSGHEVVWYTGRKFESLVATTGSRFSPINARFDFDDAEVDALQSVEGQQPGLSGFKKVLREVFINPIPDYVADLAGLFDEFEPEVVVANHTFMASMLLAEQRGLPRVAFSTGPLSLSSVDTAPFGPGLPPPTSALGRLGGRALGWAVRHVVFGGEQRAAERIRADLGLPPLDGFLIDWSALIADRYLQSSIPEFEYPRRDLPATVQFVGFTIAGGVDDWEPPAWWPEVAKARAEGVPVVFVTQGTASTDPAHLVLPAISALGSAPVLLIATTGGRDPAEVLPADRRPANLRLEPFIPFTELLPETDLMITNGGFGGVQTALACGVPLVVAGTTEDKPEVNARVMWSGAGVSLKTGTPSATQIAAAVQKVLADASYRTRAQQLMRCYAQYPGAAAAATAILDTVARRPPLATTS